MQLLRLCLPRIWLRDGLKMQDDERSACDCETTAQFSQFVQECIFFNELELGLSEKQMPRFVGIVSSSK
jgi:hypothetical protein